MFRTFNLFLLLFILVVTACEDKQSSGKNKASSPAQKREIAPPGSASSEVEKGKGNSITPETSRPSEGQEKEEKQALGIDFPIAQEALIPTLKEFGKEHPENRIRIRTSFGNIEVQLFDDTPLHRANFIMLTKDNYFDHTYIYRVSPNFVIQGGNSDNPETNQHRRKIGSYLIPSEFEAGHKHVRGAFSAAKYSEQNVSKASSPFEFFIVTKEDGAHHLDKDHTVFGKVTKGMDVVDKISEVEVGASEWPVDNIEMAVEIIR